MIGDEPKDTNPLQKLRVALHAKAKSAPDFRFYTLYDKVYRGDVLQAAWEQCRANGGAPASIGKRSRTSRSTASSGGWTNWRRNCERNGTSRNRSGGSICRNRTGSSDHWGFPRSATAWCKPPRCWSWSRSSKPICSPSSMRIARTAVPSRRCRKCIACWGKGIVRWWTRTSAGISTASRTRN